MTALSDNVNLTPEEFEIEVHNLIEMSGLGLTDFKVQRLEKLAGTDGEYEIDVTARFRALNVDFLVLIECKHHRNPIKREVVQVLYDRIRAVGGHKGMIFSTAKFQSGALEYAKTHGIALVQIADGRTAFATRGYGNLNTSFYIPEYVGWVVTLNEDNQERLMLIHHSEPQKLFPMFEVRE